VKHYQDFSRSGHSFSERIGAPTEIDAAVGRIALSFSLLEDMVRGMIQILMGGDPHVALIVTAEASFRQMVDALGSLARYRIDTVTRSGERAEALEVLDEVLQLCRRSEELRNTYMHSSYHLERRVKTTAKSRKGFRVVAEQFDSALLLDVADFISETAWICEELPVQIGFADSSTGDLDTLKCFRDGELVGSFTLPAVAPQPNQRLQPTPPDGSTRRG
jgi:hypothetical protein